MSDRVNAAGCPYCGCTWFTTVAYNRLHLDMYALTRPVQTLHTHNGTLDLPQCLACGQICLPGVTADQMVKPEYELYAEMAKEVGECRIKLGKKPLANARSIPVLAKMLWDFITKF